jgi:hypothetical protein
MRIVIALAIVVCALEAAAQMPHLVTLQCTIDPYPVADYPGGSNAVITLYKSTSLGTTWTPFKPTAYFPATRASQYIKVVSPNTFQFYATATLQPYGESAPSNYVTNTVGANMALVARHSLSRQLNAKAIAKGKLKNAKAPKYHSPIAGPRVGKRQ